MTKKLKHRILGILVLIGLGIIVLPMFQVAEKPFETVTVQAPPFPPRYVEMDTSASIRLAEKKLESNDSSSVQSNKEAVKEEPKDLFSIVRPSVVNQSSKTTYGDRVIVSADADHHPMKENKSNDFKTAKRDQTPIDNDGLINFKNAVWVIQIGSFKNKTHALNLVNMLRASGYKAFIQQIPSTFGTTTRVFVGPESKQASARALANQLEADMHIKGLVISYKPLAL